MSNELLQKVVDTTQIGAGGGGILNPKQADKFIDYIWDATVLGSEVRRIRMVEPTVDLDKIAVGERIARLATEGVDDGVNADATFTKISLTTKKIRLDWELTTEGLEDNIAGSDLEDHVARLMATQLGNDLEDLAINGDSGDADPLIKAFDGWKKESRNGARPEGAATELDHQHAALNRDAFNNALKALARKYLQRRPELRFYTSAGLLQDFIHSTGDRATDLGDNFWFGQATNDVGGRGGLTNIRPYGIPVVEVPLFREDENLDAAMAPNDANGSVELTFPKNRIWGIKREITVYREFKPKKDTLEYTVYTRTGVQLENTEAFVYVKNVLPQ